METESPKLEANHCAGEANHSTDRRSESAAEAHLSPSNSQSKRLGGWKAIKFIIGNEVFEKLASISLISNLTVYLRTNYNLSGVFLVNIVNMWMGAGNITAVFGAVISDAYWGRFLTLLYGSCCSLLGLTALTLTAAISKLRPPHCEDLQHCQPHPWQLAFLLCSLALIAIGSSGIKPCNIAFGSDQFDTKTDKGKAQLETFFNWWFFSFTIALVFALTAVVYIQTNISWTAGFAIPSACVAISITIFLIGQRTYILVSPQGTVFSDMARVVVAAMRKQKVSLKSENGLTFYDPKDDLYSRMMKIDGFKCLEKAAVITNPNELDSLGKPVNSWKLCSMHQVENMKSFVRVLPVCIAGLACFLVMDQHSTYGPLQAMQMDRSIGKHFTIPPGWMGAIPMIALSIWIFIYELIYIPIVRKITKKPSRLTMEQRILMGIIMSILCMIVAGVVEMKRRSSALKSFDSRLHIVFLLPQYILSGLAEAFSAIALMEFVILYLPESMRSVAGAIYFVDLSIGTAMSVLIVNIMHAVTGRRGKASWLGGPDLNHNKLDYYYYVIATVCGLDLIYFILVARKFIDVPMILPIGRELGLEREAEMENLESR